MNELKLAKCENCNKIKEEKDLKLISIEINGNIWNFFKKKIKKFLSCEDCLKKIKSGEIDVK